MSIKNPWLRITAPFEDNVLTKKVNRGLRGGARIEVTRKGRLARLSSA
jgi:hypothetical protein